MAAIVVVGVAAFLSLRRLLPSRYERIRANDCCGPVCQRV